MTRLRILLATLTVVPALVATVPAVAQPGGNPIPGNGGVFELAWTGDISPPVGEPRGDDYGTSELALAGQPDAVALPGDLVYECGSQRRSPHPSATTVAGVDSEASATSPPSATTTSANPAPAPPPGGGEPPLPHRHRAWLAVIARAVAAASPATSSDPRTTILANNPPAITMR